MARSFSTDIISLPRVDAREAVALASKLEAAAADQKVVPALDPPLMDALVDVADARIELQKDLTAGSPAGTPSKKEADRQEDTAVVALYTILSGWAKLADFIPEGKAAQAVLDRTFKDGVQFVNIRFDREWAVVDSKLKVIDDESLDTQIGAVGATAALAFLRKAHAIYGSVIGTTDALPESPEVGKKREALLDAIRGYVLRAAAQVDRKKPVTQTLADALLRPVVEWETAKPAKSKAHSGGGDGGQDVQDGGDLPPA